MMFENAIQILSPEIMKSHFNGIFFNEESTSKKAFISIIYYYDRQSMYGETFGDISGYPVLFSEWSDKISVPPVKCTVRILYHYNGPKYIELKDYIFTIPEEGLLKIRDVWSLIVKNNGGMVKALEDSQEEESSTTTSTSPSGSSSIVEFRSMQYEIFVDGENYLVRNLSKGNKIISTSSPIGQKIINMYKDQFEGNGEGKMEE